MKPNPCPFELNQGLPISVTRFKMIYVFSAVNNSSACQAVSDTTYGTILPDKERCTLDVQYIPRNMHTVFALLCFVVVIHWLIFPYPSGLLHWHCGNLTIAPVPAKQPWWIWINTSCEFIMNDCITTTKQITTEPCAYFLGYNVVSQTNVVNLSLVIFTVQLTPLPSLRCIV